MIYGYLWDFEGFPCELRCIDFRSAQQQLVAEVGCIGEQLGGSVDGNAVAGLA